MEEIKKQLLEGEEEEQEEEQPAPAADDTSSLENPESEPIAEEPVQDEPIAEEPVEEAPASEPAPEDNAPAEEGLTGYGTIDAAPNQEPTQGEIAQPEIVEENGAFETSIKTFTQDDVDKLVGDTRVKTREKTFRYIYDRYGVKNEDELDSLVANAQRYDTQKEMYESEKANWESEKSDNDKRLSEMSEQIALMQSQIDPERYEDAKLILKGKGLEVSLENIEAELATHPEWKKEEPVAPAPAPVPEKPQMRIKALGNEQKPAPELSEEEEAQKLFKLKW